MKHFIGCWILEEWYILTNGLQKEYPMGMRAKGTLIYTAEGMMSATLMHSERKQFNKKLKPETVKLNAYNTFIAYAGQYEIQNDKVVHHVVTSLIPNWVGTQLTRNYQFQKNNKKLILSTEMKVDDEGNIRQHILHWKRK